MLESACPRSGVKPRLASGIVNTSYQVGSAIGLAVVSAVAAGFGAGQLGDTEALTQGYSAAFIAAGIIALAGAILVPMFFRTKRPTRALPVS